MTEYQFEILRSRTVEIEERIEVTIKVPNSVPEGEREDWVMEQVGADEPALTFPDDDWEVTDETESSEYQEVTEF